MGAPLTFLFTDVEDSTRLWETAPDAMGEALARHSMMLETAVDGGGGRIVKDTGDGVMAVFESPAAAIEASLAAQQSIMEADWRGLPGPIKVRMALHTGESEERGGDFFGPTLNRAARVMGIAHGGQILVSSATHSLLGRLPDNVTLGEMGEHRLKGIPDPIAVYQLRHPDLTADFPPLRSLSTLQHNLPARQASFVGREHELQQLQGLMGETRLLTLQGAGGVGKTTLMLRAAEELVEEYPDGAWLVELATVEDPETIPERIATTLGVPEQPGRPIRLALRDYLRNKELLLVLDNVEHLVAATAALVEDLLSTCPRLSFIVTSREPLHIDGELVHRVPSLDLPDSADDAESIAASEATRLFIERAREVRPDFAVTDANAKAVAEIVRRLDGIPLALELAAARLRMLSVEQVAERLSDRFRLLTGGRRTAVARQQTLEAAIGWSWDLLDDIERLVLTRLSVFSGGWSLEAAQAVVRDDALDEFEVLDALERLVDKSLVTVAFSDSDPRYGMLESILQYARRRLDESGDADALRRRHTAYFAEFAEAAAQHLNWVRTEMEDWVARIVRDLDNLRAAVAWANDHDVETSLRIGGALLEYEPIWLTPRESSAWLEPAIAAARQLRNQDETAIDHGDFVRALLALAGAQGIGGDQAAAKSTAQECIAEADQDSEFRIYAHAVAIKSTQIRFQPEHGWIDVIDDAITGCRERDYPVELAWLLWARGWLETGADSVPYYEEAADRFLATGNPLFKSLAQRMKFESGLMLGDAAAAIQAGHEWVAAARSVGLRRTIAQSSSELAHVLRRNGSPAEAEGYYSEAIKTWQELGHEAAVAHQLESLAYIAIAGNAPERAATLLGAATAARRRLDALSEDPVEVAELDQARRDLAEALGEPRRDELLAAGSRLSLDNAVDMARSVPSGSHLDALE